MQGNGCGSEVKGPQPGTGRVEGAAGTAMRARGTSATEAITHGLLGSLSEEQEAVVEEAEAAGEERLIIGSPPPRPHTPSQTM